MRRSSIVEEGYFRRFLREKRGEGKGNRGNKGGKGLVRVKVIIFSLV